MLLQSIFAFGAIIGFSVLIEAPKRCLVVNGILGMAGWAVYLYTERYTSMLMATFVSGLVLAVISHILARLIKTPVQCGKYSAAFHIHGYIHRQAGKPVPYPFLRQWHFL